MPLSVGDRLGPCEILAPLGAGGMGEVYRARDTKLKREVAVKVLPDAFARDTSRMARFHREAEVLAALNHPHIAQIYGVEENALVMEFVDGVTLDSRIRQGPLPIQDALDIARQIAEALEAAHEKGIVHRDLKPANIKVRPDGAVKVLDFGLAAILQPALAAAAPDSATLTLGATQAGTILGTPSYMSPEQAAAKPADCRADIWSFGVVLFEMLAGQSLFAGESAPEILVEVLKGEIDFGRLPAATPSPIRRLLHRCLERDVKMRLQAIGEARIAIVNTGKDAEPAAPLPPRFAAAGWMAAAALAIVAALAGWGWWHSPRPAEKSLMRVSVDLGSGIALPSPESNPVSTVALSPDGTRLVFVASTAGGAPRLFMRRLDQSKSVELTGTNGAMGPFFSPNGQWVGFYANDRYNKISVQGGPVVPLAAVPFAGASWSDDGSIVAGGSSGLVRIPAGGGPPAKLAESANGEFVAFGPQALPGGKAVLFVSYASVSADKASVQLVTLPNGRRKTLVPGGTAARYVPVADRSGYLLYTNKATLFAVPFDLDRLELRGNAVPLLDDVAYHPLYGGAQFDVSRNGTLVYRKTSGGTAQALSTIQWLTPDAGGAARKEPLRSQPGIYMSPRISPDASRLAILLTEQGTTDLWVYDLRRDVMTRLTSGGGVITPITWSPDSRYVFYGTLRNGIFSTRSDGAGDPRPLTGATAIQAPWSIASGGKRLAYSEFAGPAQIWTVPLEETGGEIRAGKAEQFLKSSFNDLAPAFSPDRKWLAFCSNATGTYEVFVQPFPGPGGRWQISNSGGMLPVWSPNGRDLLYQSGDRIMAAAYTTQADRFIAEKPRVWIQMPPTVSPGFDRAWDLAPDGKRIAALAPAQPLGPSPQDHELLLLLNVLAGQASRPAQAP